jgi:hypothetical protein
MSKWFNAYEPRSDGSPAPDTAQPGDFLVHFAGVPDRINHMVKWCDVSEEMLPKWNQPLQNTQHRYEIDQFWTRTRNVLETRKKHWEAGTSDLTTSVSQANETLNRWKDTPETANEKFQMMLDGLEAAQNFLASDAKMDKDQVTAQDMHRLNELLQALRLVSMWRGLEE